MSNIEEKQVCFMVILLENVLNSQKLAIEGELKGGWFLSTQEFEKSEQL